MDLDQELATAERQFRAEVGRRLRAARVEADMSLDAVGERFGMTRAAVGHWETGRSPINIGQLFRLARLYKMQVAELVEGPVTVLEAAERLARYIIKQRDNAASAEAPPSTSDAAPRRNRGDATR